MKKIATTFLTMALSLAAFAQQGPFIAKGDVQIGLQGMHISASSDNSEILRLINPISGSLSLSTVSPSVSFAYGTDRVLGLRAGYTTVSADVAELGLDLLNDGLSFDVKDAAIGMYSYNVSAFHRRYHSIDRNSRLGWFSEFALSYANSHNGAPGNAVSSSNSIKLSFSPGIQFFAMENISTYASLSLASVSYTSARMLGSREGAQQKFSTRAGLDLLGINFGLVIHL